MTETETEVTAGLIRDLLRDQHPDLAELPLREVEGGWGNQMWRLGDELAVRIQRMDTDPGHQLKERRWLPLLAPRLPLPVPVPVRSGAPSERFPKLWTVMTWVPGLPLDHGSITRGGHAADTLAAFLRALHVPAPADAPVDTGRGAHPKDCTDGFDQFFDSVDAEAIGSDAGDVRAVWDDAVAAPAWEGPPVWVHGDLHPANVVVADGTLAGVVDFAEMFAGDRRPGRRGPGHHRAGGRPRAPARPRQLAEHAEAGVVAAGGGGHLAAGLLAQVRVDGDGMIRPPSIPEPERSRRRHACLLAGFPPAGWPNMPRLTLFLVTRAA